MIMLQTERLSLRPLEAGDAEAYAAIRFHPEVTRWLPPAEGEAIEAARATIGRFDAGWQQRGYAPWGVFLKDTLIGHGGQRDLDLIVP